MAELPSPIVAAVNHLRLKLNDPDVKYVATSTGTGGQDDRTAFKTLYQRIFI